MNNLVTTVANELEPTMHEALVTPKAPNRAIMIILLYRNSFSFLYDFPCG